MKIELDNINENPIEKLKRKKDKMNGNMFLCNLKSKGRVPIVMPWMLLGEEEEDKTCNKIGCKYYNIACAAPNGIKT